MRSHSCNISRYSGAMMSLNDSFLLYKAHLVYPVRSYPAETNCMVHSSSLLHLYAIPGSSTELICSSRFQEALPQLLLLVISCTRHGNSQKSAMSEPLPCSPYYRSIGGHTFFDGVAFNFAGFKLIEIIQILLQVIRMGYINPSQFIISSWFFRQSAEMGFMLIMVSSILHHCCRKWQSQSVPV